MKNAMRKENHWSLLSPVLNLNQEKYLKFNDRVYIKNEKNEMLYYKNNALMFGDPKNCEVILDSTLIFLLVPPTGSWA